ncbi:leucine-rich repeat-containing protein 72-like isoform X3 [Acropora millepora]|uniref:leucine-rich repeat-containing protein 72-like isoform X3 n=1 Tax=Acropora millepora TaxID=45264 RepID=UPI0010FC7824|nr:leucine-rich repeat-containing protein 72-like isoform X3 [Acropora millepora]
MEDRVHSQKEIEEQMRKCSVTKEKDVAEIYLADRGLEEVPDFRRFKNLQFLWLNKNKLRKLNCFDGNYQLRELYLQDNMIAALNGSLRHLTCLQVLLLNGNQLLKLTDVIHELRAMQSLETLNLFANPLAQDYDYRSYVIHHVPSLQLLDRKEISKAEKNKAKKKYDKERDCMKESLAFGRRGYCSQERVYSPSLSRTDESCHHSQGENHREKIKGVESLTSYFFQN